MKKTTQLSLKKKFLFLYICFVLLPFLVLGYYFFIVSTRYLESNLIYRSQAGIEQTNQLVAYYMSTVSYNMNTLVNSDVLHKIIEQDENTLETSQQSIEANQLRNLLSNYRIKNEISNVILYVDKYASYVSYDNENALVQHLDTIKETPWYQITETSSAGSIIIPPSILGEKEYIAYTKPVRHSGNYTITVGLLRFNIRTSDITKILMQSLQDSEDFTYIVNNNGNLVCESGENQLYLPFEEIDKYNDGQVHQINISNSPIVVYVNAIENTDWNLVYVIPYARILSKMYSQNIFLLTLFILLTTLGFVFIYFFFKLFLNRISLIKEHMSNIQAVIPPPLPEPKHTDEIGDLMTAYNYMLSRMDVLMKEQYSLGNQIHEAKMKALYEQINPHFLYNTLAMIEWLAEDGQKEDISRVISALSNFYKLCLNKGIENVYLKEEIQIIESFIYIQNMRFGTSISLDCKIEDIYENMILPKLTLQPLVENSLVHGILKRRDKSGFIKISISSDNQNFCITVSDNGIGIPADRLEHLNNGTLQNNSKHYGVKNILQRLSLYYGQNSTLTYESEPLVLTTATLIIPYI